MVHCRHCSSDHQHETALRAHLLSKHPTLKPYSCKRCQKKFKVFGSLSRHEKSCRVKADQCEPDQQADDNVNNVAEQVDDNVNNIVEQVDDNVNNITEQVDDDVKNIAEHVERECSTVLATSTATADGQTIPTGATGISHRRATYHRPRVTPSKKQKTASQLELEQYPLLLSGTVTFADFSRRYSTVSLPDDRKLGESTTAAVTRFIERSTIDCSNDILDFEEAIDNFIDSQSADSHTICNYLRYIRWYALWQYSNGKCTSIHLDVLNETIKDMQLHSSTRKAGLSLLTVLSPSELVKIRERIVAALATYQHEIVDVSLRQLLLYRVEPSNGFKKSFQCWLELCLRFVDVPMRIQASIGMVKSTTTGDFISKLEVLPDGFARVVSQDKVKSSHQPIMLKTPKLLNPYLYIFLERFSDKKSPFVFSSSKTGKWSKASRDVKAFMKESLNIDPDLIEPNGRFVHGSRKVGLASFAMKVDFCTHSLRDFCVLMRHSLDVSERYYQTWSKMESATRAANKFAQAMRGEDSEEVAAVYTPGNIHAAPVAVRNFYDDRQTFSTFKFELQDKGTSTAMDKISANDKVITPTLSPLETNLVPEAPTPLDILEVTEEKLRIIKQDSAIPNCDKCRAPLSVYGPYGLRRDTLRLGRYYLMCNKNCRDKRPNKNTYFYELGVVPNLPSQSQKSIRNKDEVNKFIFDKIGIVDFVK